MVEIQCKVDGDAARFQKYGYSKRLRTMHVLAEITALKSTTESFTPAA